MPTSKAQPCPLTEQKRRLGYRADSEPSRHLGVIEKQTEFVIQFPRMHRGFTVGALG